ncbi:MAG: TetR/AcrR family transcriptional regulator [Chloroflexi bacterium]|nr:TetR/AcrR family transcriptional regulator [Chloroflexota bacterium]
MDQRRLRDVDTATRILDVAERLAQGRGFNGFSYADVAAELHLTRAALHYHFASKTELGEALIGRYAGRFAAALEVLDTSDLGAPAKLQGYVKLYVNVLRDKRMCLCGMLAAEYQTLPQRMRAAVIHFFDTNEAWLQRVVDQGQHDGTLHNDGSARDIARAIVGGLEGAMLVARPYDDISRFQAAATHLLAGLISGDPRRQPAERQTSLKKER